MNGAGKSSVVGAATRAAGGEYFNPDETTRALLQKHPDWSPERANAAAWTLGKGLLEAAIAHRRDHAFETTLGGSTITSLLLAATEQGIAVHIRYVGVEGVEQHLARVRARVQAGGHDIPEAKIRERYDTSRQNLIRLLPHVAELELFDNSVEASPLDGHTPEPPRLLHLVAGRIIELAPLPTIPAWAQPIVAAALRLEAQPEP